METETCSIIRRLFISGATINPKIPLSWNTFSEELNAHHSPFLDHMWADNNTSKIHIAFTNSNKGPKRSLERPETECAIWQYGRDQRKRHDSRRSERLLHSPALTVWNKRN